MSSSSRVWLSRGLLLLLVVLVVVGIISGAGYLYLRLAGSSNPGSPVEQLQSSRVEPTLALASLAGAGDLEVVSRALENGELETAYATIFFSTDLSHGEQVGSLLLLGGRYATAGDQAGAQKCYERAGLITTMSPTLSDSTRAQSFLAIGGGFAALGRHAEALANLDQAFALAIHSPFMKDPHRAGILDQLAVDFAALGEREKSSESRSLQEEILYSTTGPEARREGQVEQPSANFLAPIPAPTTAMVSSYEERRTDAVLDLQQFLQDSSPGAAISEDLSVEVTQALVNEDKARSTAYEDELAAASSMVLRIGIAQARADWLLTKYRVALGAYGLELVPAWSEDVSGIAAELNGARAELHDIYREQISTFGDDMAKDRAWFDILRLEILQGELGLYPGYPAENLISELDEVSGRLTAAGDPSLFPEVRYEGTTPSFSLAWNE